MSVVQPYSELRKQLAARDRSLREKVLPLPDTTLVLPGHYQATTMAHERATNPYLRDLGA